MQTLAPATDRKLRPPRFTPYFCRQVEQLAAAEGLPPDPWPPAA